MEQTLTVKNNIVQEKSYEFAKDVVRFSGVLQERRHFAIADQLIRCGTSVGANVEEAIAGQSRRDFLSKMTIASREARESWFWLRLIRDTKLLSSKFEGLLKRAEELVRILTSIVKTTSQTVKRK